jgi:hypothetical protein
VLLSTALVERRKLEALVEDRQTELEEAALREKCLQQENEQLNREYVRWKERFAWLEKEKEGAQREFEEDRAQLLSEFAEY